MRAIAKFDIQNPFSTGNAFELLGEFAIGKLISDSLPQFDIRNLFKRRRKTMKNETPYNSVIDKMLLLRPISRLYELPEFDDDETSKQFTDSFYDVVIKLTRELTINENEFRYFKINLTTENIENKDQLIGWLIRERKCPSRNDSRYLLGFRSIWYILKNNLDKVDGKYISDINSRLRPFFASYRHKTILIPGISL